MPKKEKVLSTIKEKGLIAVIRAESSAQAIKIADACVKGGVTVVEITFTVPGVHNVIEDLSKHFNPGEVIIGAGTVLDPETARVAILSGAQYIVSPCLSIDTIKLCNRYQIACMPGAMTIKEVLECMEQGADIIKIFPGELFGPAIIKAIAGPFPQAQMVPTGGVNVLNVLDWINAGAVAVGVGSSLTKGAKNDDYNSITNTAIQFVEKISEARSI